MRQQIICLLASVLLTYGVRAGAENTSPINPVIQQGCKELDGMGNVTSVRRAIAQDMQSLQKLLRGQSVLRVKDEVLQISERIKANTDLLRQMVDSRYSEVVYEQEQDWTVDLRSLNSLFDLNPYLSINGAKLLELYNWSTRETEDITRATVTSDRTHLQVHLLRPASLLEICQLPQTIMMTVELDVQSLFYPEKVTYNFFTKEAESNENNNWSYFGLLSDWLSRPWQ